jgi:hypothetical protein
MLWCFKRNGVRHKAQGVGGKDRSQNSEFRIQNSGEKKEGVFDLLTPGSWILTPK